MKRALVLPASLGCITMSTSQAAEFYGNAAAYILPSPGDGVCQFMFWPETVEKQYAALNAHQWGSDASACGQCMEIWCDEPFCESNSREVVHIVDQCKESECRYGDLQLSPSVYRQILGENQSEILSKPARIRWRYTDCPREKQNRQKRSNTKICLVPSNNEFQVAIQPFNDEEPVQSVMINGKKAKMDAYRPYFHLESAEGAIDVSRVHVSMQYATGRMYNYIVTLVSGECVEVHYDKDSYEAHIADEGFPFSRSSEGEWEIGLSSTLSSSSSSASFSSSLSDSSAFPLSPDVPASTSTLSSMTPTLSPPMPSIASLPDPDTTPTPGNVQEIMTPSTETSSSTGSSAVPVSPVASEPTSISPVPPQANHTNGSMHSSSTGTNDETTELTPTNTPSSVELPPEPVLTTSTPSMGFSPAPATNEAPVVSVEEIDNVSTTTSPTANATPQVAAPITIGPSASSPSPSTQKPQSSSSSLPYESSSSASTTGSLHDTGNTSPMSNSTGYSHAEDNNNGSSASQDKSETATFATSSMFTSPFFFAAVILAIAGCVGSIVAYRAKRQRRRSNELLRLQQQHLTTHPFFIHTMATDAHRSYTHMASDDHTLAML